MFEVPDDALPHDHPARVLWQVFDKLVLSAFLADARCLEGAPGRPTMSPRMLLTLFPYAISRGVGSARELENLCHRDTAYRWIVGAHRPNHSTLSRFRVGHLEALDTLLSDVLACLVHAGVLTLETVAVDGMRIRAKASAPSFRREASLEELREQAALHLRAVLAQADDPELTAGQRAMREAKARDFRQRVERAIETVHELNEGRRAGSKPARASTTDPEARNMKMADGGFRPAMNLQMATAGDVMGGPRTIVAVGVTHVGSDMGTLAPMIEQVERRTGALPKTAMADANHANHEAIAMLERRGVEVLVPVPERTSRSKKTGSADIEKWKARMQSPEAKKTYQGRASLCELESANARRMGLTQLPLRGLQKATCLGLLFAIAHDILAHAATLLG